MSFFRNAPFEKGPYTVTPNDAMMRVLQDVGLASGPDMLDVGQVTFFGGREEGLLNINTNIAVIAAGLYGALGLIIDQFGQMRGLPPQTIAVEVDHAAMAMSKMHWLLVNGMPPDLPESQLHRGGGYPATGNFQCNDGRWININSAFPGLRNTVLRVLGCPNDREAIVAAVAKWNSIDLEEAIVAEGGTAAVMRTPEEWASHPQGRILLSKPLVQIEKVAESDPVPLKQWPMAPFPLSGFREIDLTHVLAGPTGTQLSAEAGADVLRVVGHQKWLNPMGDIDLGMGKRSTMLSLDDSEHRKIFFELLKGADAFIQGFNPGSIYRLLGGQEAVFAARPGLIVVDESCYGADGPWSGRAGWEQLAQAVSGMMYIQKRFGELSPAEGGIPIMTPVYTNDYATGILSAIGKLTAYLRRAREGGSYRVRAQLARTASLVVEMGTIDLDREPHNFSRAEVLLRSRFSHGPHGQLWTLAPVAQLSQTPLRYNRPAPEWGSDSPVWLADNEVYMNAALMAKGNTYSGGSTWL